MTDIIDVAVISLPIETSVLEVTKEEEEEEAAVAANTTIPMTTTATDAVISAPETTTGTGDKQTLPSHGAAKVETVVDMTTLPSSEVASIITTPNATTTIIDTTNDSDTLAPAPVPLTTTVTSNDDNNDSATNDSEKNGDIKKVPNMDATTTDDTARVTPDPNDNFETSTMPHPLATPEITPSSMMDLSTTLTPRSEPTLPPTELAIELCTTNGVVNDDNNDDTNNNDNDNDPTIDASSDTVEHNEEILDPTTSILPLTILSTSIIKDSTSPPPTAEGMDVKNDDPHQNLDTTTTAPMALVHSSNSMVDESDTSTDAMESKQNDVDVEVVVENDDDNNNNSIVGNIDTTREEAHMLENNATTDTTTKEPPTLFTESTSTTVVASDTMPSNSFPTDLKNDAVVVTDENSSHDHTTAPVLSPSFGTATMYLLDDTQPHPTNIGSMNISNVETPKSGTDGMLPMVNNDAIPNTDLNEPSAVAPPSTTVTSPAAEDVMASNDGSIADVTTTIQGNPTPTKATSPAVNDYFNVEAGTFTSHSDFITQQSARIKLNKQREQEARMSLTSPVKSPAMATSPKKVDLDAGAIAPYNDFVQQQSAQIKANKLKEREALQALNSPSKELPRSSLSSDDLPITPYNSFVSQQSAQIKANKDKERQARKSLHSPINANLISPSSDDNNAAEIGLSPDLYSDAASRTAAQMRVLKEEQLKKKKEADAHASSYRQNDLLSDASSRNAAKLQELKIEQAKKKKEAEDHTSSYRNVDLLGDASARTAAQLQLMKEESIQKKKEAEQLAKSFRSTGIETASAQDVVAANLKHQQEHEKRQKKEALQMMHTYRSKMDDTFNHSSSEVNDSGPEVATTSDNTSTEPDMSEHVTSPRTLDDFKARTDDELALLTEQRKQFPISPDLAQNSSAFTDIKSKTAADLATLQSNASSVREQAEEMVRKFGETNNHDKIKAQTASEVLELKGKVAIRGINFSGGNVDEIKARTSNELEMIKSTSSLKDRVKYLDQEIATTKVEHVRGTTDSELLALRSSRSRDLATDFFEGKKGNTKLDELKSKQAQELAALQDVRRQNELESTASLVTPNFEMRQVSFTQDELVAFDEERKRREKELSELKELTSRKKFESLRSGSSKELQEIAEQRKLQKQREKGDLKSKQEQQQSNLK